MMHGFLHRHMIQESILDNTKHEHVIVDKADWENALKLVAAADTLAQNAKRETRGNMLPDERDLYEAVSMCKKNTHR